MKNRISKKLMKKNRKWGQWKKKVTTKEEER